ncbi:uncharacterized protein [Dendrobates tinctorius]|uniref:uncharacterized protein n=1 Tax=Dendrobates tinctorius TaxID=92724 RepID=UPI003CCA184F
MGVEEAPTDPAATWRISSASYSSRSQPYRILSVIISDLLYKRIFLIDPSRKDRDRDKMVEKILHLTLEILFRLTGENYTVVKKTSSERCQAPVSEEWRRPVSPITGPPPHRLIHEDINDKKILELTYKMIELLTGEVPIRCQDVTVFFSMEEWEYLEGHKDLYKDVMMEDPQPLTLSGLCSKRITPERCPHPLLPEDGSVENPNVPQDHQVLTIWDPLSADLLYKRIFLIYPSRMDKDRDKMAEKILHLTLDILFRLTGEDYTVVKKTSSERCQDPVSEGWERPVSPMTGPPLHPLIHEDISDQEILELTYKMIELLTGEVPIRCQDVAVYFSMEEWEYLEGHKDLYKDIMMEVPQPLTSPDLSGKRTTPERCPRPLLPQDCKQEDPNVPQDHQVTTILDPLSGDLLYKRIFLIDPTRMDRSSDKMAERILHLTLEILFRLIGEDYTVVKKTSRERCQDPVSEGWGRPQSPIMGPPPHPLIHEDINDQKILELSYKMIELLTGEVPIRCQDVAVYISMEEWEYLEGHKDLYKDIMMEVPQPLTSPDLSSKKTTPERCPRPLLPQGWKQENLKEGEDLTHINTTETYVRGDEWCKEEIPADNRTDDSTGRQDGHLTYSVLKSDDLDVTQDTSEMNAIIPDIPSSLHSKDLSDPSQTMPTILNPLSGDILYKRIFVIDPSRMDRDRNKMVGRMLHLTLEILFRLTGEEYTVVKKTSSERCQAPVSEGWGRTLSPITGTPPDPLIHEDINVQKILELTYKMIELLTGQVPIRHQDVTIFLSMEEWEYLEAHKDLYKNIMMEVPQPLTSPVLSSKRTTPERCFRPLLPQDCKENPDVPQDHQGEDLTHINTTETYVRGDEWCNEEIAKDNCTGDCTSRLKRQLISSVPKSDDLDLTQITIEVNAITPDIPSSIHSKDLSSDPFTQIVSSDSSRTIKKNKSHKGVECGKYSNVNVKHWRIHTVNRYTGNRYLCSECGKCFAKKSNLVRHYKLHTGEKSFSCSECGKCFVDKSHLVTHTRCHTGEKPYSCSECGKCFRDKTNFVRHQKNHKGERPYSCSECGKCFADKSNLLHHHRIHTGVKPYSCSECGNSFKVKSHLVKHQKVHIGEKPYSCPQCQKCFTDKSLIITHLRLHAREKPFSCSECGKCFAYKSNVIKHQKIHTGEKPFSCSQCGKCFVDNSRLVRHFRVHTGEKPYLCSECGKYFTWKWNLVVHQKSHTGEKLFSCSKCGKCFANKSNLVRHYKLHTGDKPFSCSECGKCFSDKSHFVTHKRSHTGEKPYSCSECGKCFTDKSYVVRHQKIHTEERAHSCSECGKCFADKSSLVNHQTIHTGVNLFSCSECGKCFVKKSNLVRHQRNHPEEKYFSCSECGNCFATKLQLVTHNRCHTEERPYSCSECGKCFRSKSYFTKHQKLHTGEKPFHVQNVENVL